MSRRPARFTQADISRVIRAVQQSGANMRVEVTPDGTIRIVPVDKNANGSGMPHGAIEQRGEIVL